MTIRAEPESFHAATALAAPARSLFVQAVKNIGATWRSMRNRRSVTRMLELDDHMLRDMGVTRYDVTSALASPVRQDPSAKLAEFSKERRKSRHRLGSYELLRRFTN